MATELPSRKLLAALGTVSDRRGVGEAVPSCTDKYGPRADAVFAGRSNMAFAEITVCEAAFQSGWLLATRPNTTHVRRLDDVGTHAGACASSRSNTRFTSIPVARFSIGKFSSGECILDPGDAKPTRRVSAPKNLRKAPTIGTLAPERTSAVSLPNTRRSARCAARPSGESGRIKYQGPT